MESLCVGVLHEAKDSERWMFSRNGFVLHRGKKPEVYSQEIHGALVTALGAKAKEPPLSPSLGFELASTLTGHIHSCFKKNEKVGKTLTLEL